MLRRIFAVFALLAASSVSAQVGESRSGGSSGSSSSTITNGVTATSGCVAGGVLRSISNLVECGAGFTYATGIVGVGTASTLDGAIRIFSGDHANYTELTVSASQSANAAYTFPINDGPAVSRIENNGSGVLSWKFDQTKYVTADQSDSGGSFVDVNDLGFAVESNTVYTFQCSFITLSAATTTAVHIAFNGPVSPTNFNYSGTAFSATNAVVFPSGTAYDSTTGLPVNFIGSASNTQTFGGTLENGANAGTFIARLKTEVGASAVTVQRGSWCRVWTP